MDTRIASPIPTTAVLCSWRCLSACGGQLLTGSQYNEDDELAVDHSVCCGLAGLRVGFEIGCVFGASLRAGIFEGFRLPLACARQHFIETRRPLIAFVAFARAIGCPAIDGGRQPSKARVGESLSAALRTVFNGVGRFSDVARRLLFPAARWVISHDVRFGASEWPTHSCWPQRLERDDGPR